MPESTQTHRTLARVLLAAAVVAAADLADAIVAWVVILQRSTVQRVLQAIAAGLLGPASFRGGWKSAFLGLALHCCIALGWTLVFLALLERWRRLQTWVSTGRGRVAVGLAYGALVWLLMAFVVLPLSRARVPSPTTPWFWVQLATHPFVVGLPIVGILATGARRRAAVAGRSSHSPRGGASAAAPSGRRRRASRLHGPPPAAEK